MNCMKHRKAQKLSKQDKQKLQIITQTYIDLALARALGRKKTMQTIQFAREKDIERNT